MVTINGVEHDVADVVEALEGNMSTIKMEIKTEYEIREWMNKDLQAAKCQEFSFNELRKREPEDIGDNDCHWTTANYAVSRSTNDETRDIDCEGIASEIEARASSLFDME